MSRRDPAVQSPVSVRASLGRSRSRLPLALAAVRPAVLTVSTARGHSTAASAEAAAGRACSYLCAVEGLRRADGRFVPVVRLRPDQGWLRERVAERGVVVADVGEALC